MPSGGLLVCDPEPLLPLAGGEAGLTLMSDLHLGADSVDYDHIEGELQVAARKGDRILLGGDVFDAVIHQDQKRFSPGVLHKRLRGVDDVLNKALDWAVEILAPYAKLIDVVGTGNHETAVVKHHGVDLALELTRRLRAEHGSPAQHAGYGAFVRYRWSCTQSRFVIFYWHGAGSGNAFNEFHSRGAFVEGAHAVWYAHRHQRLVAQAEKLSCPAKGRKPRSRLQWLLRTGAYMSPYAGGQSQASLYRRGRKTNYAAENLCSPHGRGGLRLVLSPSGTSRVEVPSHAPA